MSGRTANSQRNWFFERRSALGLSLYEMAQRIAVTPSAIQTWETFGSAPRPQLTAELAKAYEAPFNDIAVQICLLAARVSRPSKSSDFPGSTRRGGTAYRPARVGL